MGTPALISRQIPGERRPHRQQRPPQPRRHPGERQKYRCEPARGESPQRHNQVLRQAEQPVSLDTPGDDDAHYPLAETIEDSAIPAFADVATQHLLSEELHQALASLTPRERSVITLRYGIGDGRSRTLLEVGKDLGISRERVRQLEAVALKKMRSRLGYQ